MGENSSSSDYTKQIDDKFSKAIQNAASGTKKKKLELSTLPILNYTGDFEKEYEEFLEFDKHMPPETNVRWKKPADTMKYFQQYIQKYESKDDSSIVDMTQLIQLMPLLRVNELLLLVDNKYWLITQCIRLFMTHAYLLKHNQQVLTRSTYPVKIVYVLSNEKAKLKRYKELVKSKCIKHAANTYFTDSDRALFMRSLTECEKNPVIDLQCGNSKISKIVTFMTHVQSGDYIKEHGNAAFDDSLLVIDEMFDLQMKMNGASWKPSFDRFNEFLQSRNSNGSTCKVLGLTECLYKSLDGFVDMINYFAPTKSSELHINELRTQLGAGRFLGYRVLLNSQSLSDKVYSQLLQVQQRIQLYIPSQRTPEDINWILTVSSGNKNI